VAARATATLIKDTLIEVVRGRDAMAVPGHWIAMVQAIRNLGRPGIAPMAIAAVDTALWDLKARILDVPMVTLFGAARDGVPVYGSGGSHRILSPSSSSSSAAGPTMALRV
jgi:L-alanine-DL-glutamate epimerase-like enolase superfamily enzyme